ncbi:chalcone isomerase family protein [Psychrosphaera sp. F3M07]|uniref:chalcone isomerase family protein n=1 Tax=Psychrosphaera sp. F3M07 TaxID=2841560 RepID=UPI001C0A26C9|nr:chalcone isomerase family protein [Psychrosphaera sp. F3M07]MBU2918517.1 chalcone isomerase family protein [Psychrosphaera sp. F3M07]
MKTLRISFIIFILIFHSTFTQANVVEKSEMNRGNEQSKLFSKLPDDLTDIGYVQVGNATFTFLFWDIYNSRLFTKTGKYDDNSGQDLLFKINYLKDISADELIKRTVEQWQHLKYDESKYQHYIPKMKSIWPDIKSGDSLTLYRKNQTTIFYFNNEEVGNINDKSFSNLFLDIWLSNNTSQPKLRKLLIGE